MNRTTCSPLVCTLLFVCLIAFPLSLFGEQGIIKPSDGIRFPEPFSSLLVNAAREVRSEKYLPSTFVFPSPPSEETTVSNAEIGEPFSVSLDHNFSRLGYYRLNFHLDSWRASGERDELKGEVERVYPRKLEGFSKPQLLREKVFLSHGSQESPLGWLTIRSLSPARDNIWAHSPALRRVRRLNAVNREDRLLSSAFSLDDLTLFGRKGAGLRLQERKEEGYLVPFATKQSLTVSEGALGCLEVSPSLLRGAAQLLFGRALGNQERIVRWLTADIAYERDTLVLVLEAEDPYRELSHEIVVVDKEFSVPVYRMSYDVLGRLRYSAYQVFGHAKDGSGDFQVPVVVYQLVYDHEADLLTVLSSIDHRWCPVTKPVLDSFQPQRLVAKDSKIPDPTVREQQAPSAPKEVVGTT